MHHCRHFCEFLLLLKKKCKQSFEFCQYLNESSQRRKLNIRCLTNCRSIWSKGSGYKYAFCLEFTYTYNQEIFGLFVNRTPLLLLYRLPELKSFRVLWQNNSLSPTDPGCPCQSYKSKGVESNVLSYPKTYVVVCNSSSYDSSKSSNSYIFE